MRYYGSTPGKLIAEGLTLHDVAAMAAHLPRDCASMMSLYPPTEYEYWSDPTFGGGIQVALAAAQFDLLAAANWQRTGKQSGQPKPLQRPTPPTAPGVQTGFDTPNDFAAWYAQQPGGRQIT